MNRLEQKYKETKTSIKYDGGYMEKDIDKVRQFCINADAAAAKIGQ